MAASPKILQFEHSRREMFSVKHRLRMDLLSEFSQLVFLTESNNVSFLVTIVPRDLKLQVGRIFISRGQKS